MLITILISLGFLLLLGLIMIKGSYDRLHPNQVPELYQLPIVKLLLKWVIFVFIAYAGFLIFYSWKLFFVLLILGILTARFTTVIFWDVVLGAIFGDKRTRHQPQGGKRKTGLSSRKKSTIR